MDKRVIRGMAAGVLVVLAAMTGRAQRTIYVNAQRGNDGNDGSAVKPFASLARARDAVRALKKAGVFPEQGVAIEASGNFSLASENVVLDAQDGGSGADAPLVIRTGA